MQQLDALVREATELGTPAASHNRVIPIKALSAAEAEVDRVMTICNSCRYCEGFCAVFPAMTRRLEFGKADINYLANLCHNCGACLHACQYATPHEFAINVPQAMAKVRLETYIDYAWPPAFGALYKRNGLTLALALTAALTLFLALAAARQGSLLQPPPAGGNFYSVFPHNLMVSLFAPVFLFALLALGLGLRRFWKDVSPGAASAAAIGDAADKALRLKFLDGGHGQGCNEADDAFTLARRRFHHFTFYGFLLCFAATSVATLFHYLLGWEAPYDYASLPKLLGLTGGISLVIGTIGLLRLNLQRHAMHGDAAQQPMDRGFIVLLLLAALTGLALLPARGSAALTLTLCLHLGAVMALFATMPYGKFAHGFFRTAALLKWAIEKRQPSNLQLGDD